MKYLFIIKFYFTLQILFIYTKISLQFTSLDYKESYLEKHASYDLPYSIDFREYQFVPDKKMLSKTQMNQIAQDCPLYSNYLSLSLMSDILYIRNQRVFSTNQTMTFQNNESINIEPLQMVQNMWRTQGSIQNTFCKQQTNDNILDFFISDNQNKLLTTENLTFNFVEQEVSQVVLNGTQLDTFASQATNEAGTQSGQKIISVFQKLNVDDKLTKENITQIKQVLVSGLPVITYLNNKNQNTCEQFDQLGLIIGYGKQNDIPVWVIYVNGSIQYYKIGQNQYCSEMKLYTIEPTDFFKQDSQGFINILYLQKWTYQFVKGNRNQDGFLQDDLINIDLTKQEDLTTIKTIFGVVTVIFAISYLLQTGKR